MAAVSNSLVVARHSPSQLSMGAFSPADQSLGSFGSAKVSLPSLCHVKSRSKPLVIQATYSDDSRFNSAGIFVGGFVLGGLVVGALGCIYAPQISKVLAGPDRKELMRKLPKFIYDEEKALERTRKILTDKIAQLNSAIDEVSSQLRSDNSGNGVAVSSSDKTKAK